MHALLLLQAESVQGGQVQSEQSELLGLAESEQVFKGRKCPQLSCTLPGLAIWALFHLFLPPTRLFKLWDVFQNIQLSHFTDEKSKAQRREMISKSEPVVTN